MAPTDLLPALPWLAPFAGLSALFWALISYGMTVPVTYGLGYPLGAAMGLYMASRSIWRGGRRVDWRARVHGSGHGSEPDGRTAQKRS